MRLIGPDEAAAQIAAELGVRVGASVAAQNDLIVAEYIRQALEDLSARDAASSAVYVSAITNNVRRQLAAVIPGVEARQRRRPSEREQLAEGDIQPDPVRRVFEALEDLREIDHLGRGYYAATPTRLVNLDGATALVVSGSPTREIERQLQARVSVDAITRTMLVREVPDRVSADESWWQPTPSWLGTPPGDLEAWTAAQLDRAGRKLSVSSSDVTEFEVYQPGPNRTRPQAFRWVPAKGLRGERDVLLLCRAAEGRFGLRRYWLGTLTRSRGERRADRESQVERADVTRLQYGIDRLHDAPTTVKMRQASGVPRLTLTSMVPPEERRALTAMARDRSPRFGKFPMRYDVPENHLPFILTLLENLRVAVVAE